MKSSLYPTISSPSQTDFPHQPQSSPVAFSSNKRERDSFFHVDPKSPFSGVSAYLFSSRRILTFRFFFLNKPAVTDVVILCLPSSAPKAQLNPAGCDGLWAGKLAKMIFKFSKNVLPPASRSNVDDVKIRDAELGDIEIMTSRCRRRQTPGKGHLGLGNGTFQGSLLGREFGDGLKMKSSCDKLVNCWGNRVAVKFIGFSIVMVQLT